MKQLLTGILLFIMINLCGAEELITNTGARQITSLNGQWNTIVDPYEIGYYNYRYLPDPNGYFNDAKPQSRSDRVEYDFDNADILNVPGDWNSQQENLFLYEGTVWYRKTFDYNLKSGKRLFVYFGAVNYQAIVFLNGQKLGEHNGGFTPFNFEITDLVKEKHNSIIIKVDNKRFREAVPTLHTDWWNYGGITRDVLLVETGDTFIRDYFIQLQKGSVKIIRGWVKLDGVNLQQSIKLEIPKAGISTTFTANQNGEANFTIPAQVKLWSPEDPVLYDVILTYQNQVLTDKIGFRSIETNNTDILLNGKPVYLKGICIHEEAPLRSGRAYSREDARILLGWAKEMNCNFVRLAHYSHNENMIRVADEMGIMVWSEIPVYWTILWENKDTFTNAANQLTEMITRDKNRASIILWSMANETPISDARLEFLRKLTEITRTLDPTRLITAAMEKNYKDDNTIVIDDPFGTYLDVLGCNEYLGWYDGPPEKCGQVTWESIYNKPVIFSEFGGGALAGMHKDIQTIWSEEYQENLYIHQTRMFEKIPFLKGTTPWILMDFRSPRRPLKNIQDFYNRKGLISNKGEKKKAFYIMQKYYQDLASYPVK